LTLQYADDTAIIAATDTGTLVMIDLVLAIFARVSGLKINYSKSSFVPFNLTARQIQETVAITRCIA
jgi:hypothetical protein